MPGSTSPTTLSPGRVIVGLLVVFVSMVFLFLLPSRYFIGATIGSMTTMIVVTFLLTNKYSGLFHPSPRTVLLGLASAAVLYLVFYAGNAGIQALHPLGVSGESEDSIYSLIASPSNPLYLQVAVLAFDAAGYESFFRGVVQTSLEPRLGVASPIVVALLDASIHLLTMNLLWVVTTFIADSFWGLTYHYARRDLTSNMLSHFLWDIAIFIVAPIR